MINKELKEKTIKWVKFEAEVLTEVEKMLLELKITPEQWEEFLLGILKEHGTNNMRVQFESYMLYMKSIKALVDGMKEWRGEDEP